MKLYSALYDSFYPFAEMELFSDYEVIHHADKITDSNSALVVWGGQDISPSLYNKVNCGRTHADDRPSRRDQLEWDLMKGAKEKGVPIIGICRGAQMLCALAGGFLVQDITDHTSAHNVETNEGLEFHVSSLHHQMMYPFDVEHQMIAWSQRKLSRHYADADKMIPVDEVPIEPEFVYFPKERGIAIQWHPEFMRVDCKANNFVKKYLEANL